MNRLGLGLAVGAGYLLGRTRKLKLAVAVGSLAAGKKLNLGPRAVADLVNQQLKDNPQFKEIGDQLRQDLRGVGKAASGAMVERQMTTLADRLHGRTSQVREQLSGAVPDTGDGKGRGDGKRRGDDEGRGGGERAARDRGHEDEYPEDEHEEEAGEAEEYEDEYDDREGREAEEDAETADGSDGSDRSDRSGESGESRRQRSAKAPAKSAAKSAREGAEKARSAAPGRKTAKRPPAQKGAPAKKATKKQTAAAGGATRATRSRLPDGGGDR